MVIDVDLENFWIMNFVIGLISGILLAVNRYNTSLWISAIEIIIILNIIITVIKLIVARNDYEMLVSQIFKNFFMNLWQIIVGVLIGLCFTAFIIGLFN